MTKATADRRVAGAVAAAIALAVALVWGRAVIASHQAFDQGEQARAEGDVASAILFYRHAIQWHAPLGSSCGDALDALVALGDERAAAGDMDTALFAWRSARAGVMATRHLWTPHADVLGPLHRSIGAAMAEQVGGDIDADSARFTAQLDDWRARSPRPLLAAGASALFVTWLAALMMLAWRGLTPEGTIARQPALRWAAASAAAFVGWVVLVRLA